MFSMLAHMSQENASKASNSLNASKEEEKDSIEYSDIDNNLGTNEINDRDSRHSSFKLRNHTNKAFSADKLFISSLESLSVNIDGFERDERFDKILILKNEKYFYVCGRLYFPKAKAGNKFAKLHLDIELKHQMIPSLYGLDTSSNSKEYFEIRKIPFEPYPLTKQSLSRLTRSQLMRMISQLIDFANFLSNEYYSISLMTLDDLFACSFLDSNNNLYFGDLSFIEANNYRNKNIYCIGLLIYQLLGGELSFDEDQTVKNILFDRSFPLFWKQFISTNWIENVHVPKFFSEFMQNTRERIVFPLKDEIESNELDIDEEDDEECSKKELREIGKLVISESDAREAVNKYKSLRYIPVTVRKNEKFKNFKVKIKEDNSLVFDNKIKEETIEKAVSKFLMYMEIQHPMLLPLTGFSCDDSTLRTFHIYRETNQHFTPIKEKNLKKSSNDLKIKWARQTSEFVKYLIDEENYKITSYSYEDCAALDVDDNIIFVNLDFLKRCKKSDDIQEINADVFFDFLECLWDDEHPLPSNFPVSINNIFSKEREHRNYKYFCTVRSFLKNYDPNTNYFVSEVYKYLEDYRAEQEIEGHQCHVTVYKRKLSSGKKFKRLVLKKYNFVFSDNLKILLNRVKDNEKLIIDTWESNNESFMLMKYIKAQKLKDIIQSLDYEQKISILKNIGKKIENHKLFIFCNLSIGNIYVTSDSEIEFLDCLFVADDNEDPLLPPEVKRLSSASQEEKDVIDVYSLGIISYEMFGGSYNSEGDLHFEGFPLFIENLVRICCKKKAIDRARIKTVIEKLDKYQVQDVERLFKKDLIDVSPYYIDQSDIYRTSIGKMNGCVTQRSTKKLLIEKSPGEKIFSYIYADKGVERMKGYIQASHCRNGFPIYGFSFEEGRYVYYYEYTSKLIDLVDIKSLDNDSKIDIILKLSQFSNDLYKNDQIIDIYSTEMIYDKNNQIKFLPAFYVGSMYQNSRIKRSEEAIDRFARFVCDTYNGSGYDDISPETPLIIQALVRRMVLGKFEERTNFPKVEKVLSEMNTDLTSDIDVDWEVTRGSLENWDEYMIYKSNKNADLVEEGIRVEILMEYSNLFSYSRKSSDFALFYHGKCNYSFISDLFNLESLSIKAAKERNKIKDFRVESEYNGEHCLVQFLVNNFYNNFYKKIVLKKYHKSYGKLEFNGRMNGTTYWKEDENSYVLQEYEEVETLEDCVNRSADFLDEKFKIRILKTILGYDEYYRFSPHNICLSKRDNKFIVVDNLNIRENTYEDFKNEFTAPECSRFSELNSEDKESMTVYSAGWIAYVLFNQEPEIDTLTNKFKPPTFPDNFPKFWRDFISLSTRENSLDRPLRSQLREKIESQSPFEEADFVLVSSKLLNHSDYSIEDPIGAGGEAIVFLATDKLTGEKHACKELNHEIRSIEIKKTLLAIEKLDSSVFGIKYIGISISKRKNVYLHMEYVPNGSLREIIALDRRMKPPSWFNESAKLRLAKEIAEGMRSLHDQGIVHKDLKPENILLDSNNNTKICDFSFIPEEGAATPLFMAPELINGEEATYKSDVYSYAVTLACLFSGGEMIGSVKKAVVGGFRPSISVSTPSSIQTLIRKCWQQNPDDRPTFNDIVGDLEKADLDDDDLKIKSMDEFPDFDARAKRGVLSDGFEYEICEIDGDADTVEHFVRLHMTIQPENMLHIHKYCRLGDRIILILEKSEKFSFDLYLCQKRKVSQTRGEKYVSDLISLFELYHKNGFCFGPFSLKRLFFRDRHRSSICFDLFMIPGLVRPQNIEEVLISPPEGNYSREGDIFAFACFVLKMFDNLIIDSEGKVSTQPFKAKAKSSIPLKYKNIIMEKCLSPEPNNRPTFGLLFQKLFPVQYRIISNFLSVSVSRFSTFSMRKDFKQEDIEFMGKIGEGTYGRVIHAFNKVTQQDLAVKEFNDSHGKKNEDFMLEYVALKAIDHPNIVKIVGASQRKESSHGSRLFMEFAGGGDMRKNIKEPFEWFVVHLLQVSSAMKYLHQRGIVHLDLKPENILIRSDGSAVVADFNTAMHVDIDTHLQKQRGSENYMSPEILRCENYSFSTDVFSFGLMAAEHFSSDAHRVIREANDKHTRPSLDFIDDKWMRSLLEFCVDDDPMSRPSFDFICNFLFNKFIKDTPRAEELESILRIPRIDDDKLNQLRVLASRGSSEAILEYGKYLLLENSFADAMHVLCKGANEGDARCQNTFGVLSKEGLFGKIVKHPGSFIEEASKKGDKYAMTNYGFLIVDSSEKVNESIELLEKAYSMGVTHAGYLLGLVYESNDIEGMTYEERVKKAIELYCEAAKEGDAFAQFKYGVCLEEGLAEDEDGFDCVHYFRKSAYQRCRKGVSKYLKYIEGERKEYYASLKELLPRGNIFLLWEDEQIFYEEMMSNLTGMQLLDPSSKERFNFLLSKIFSKLKRY